MHGAVNHSATPAQLPQLSIAKQQSLRNLKTVLTDHVSSTREGHIFSCVCSSVQRIKGLGGPWFGSIVWGSGGP